MEPAIRSGIGLPIVNAMLNNCPYEALPNSTLNQKYNILNGINNGLYNYPVINYFAIGAGDIETIVLPATGTIKTRPKLHRATDAAPFKQRPFVARLLDEDLTDGEREMFALRRKETHRGKDYWVYYLCRLPTASIPPTSEYYQVIDGVKTQPVAWNPNASDLDPIGRTYSDTGVNIIANEFISSTVPREINWTTFMKEEYLNVARVLFDNEEEAIINDIAIVAGLDKTVSVPNGHGGNFMMKEVIMATCMAWVYKQYDAVRDDLFTFVFNSSIEEPVFVYTNPPTIQAGNGNGS
jgi:hypothetical protein